LKNVNFTENQIFSDEPDDMQFSVSILLALSISSCGAEINCFGIHGLTYLKSAGRHIYLFIYLFILLKPQGSSGH